MLKPVAVTKDDTMAKNMVAVMMPTTILGTPTAKRSLNADAKQNLPYCRHMPYMNPNHRYAER